MQPLWGSALVPVRLTVNMGPSLQWDKWCESDISWPNRAQTVFIRLQWTVSKLPHQEGLGAEETLCSQWVPEWSGKCSIMFPKLEWSLLLAQAEPGLSSQNKYKALLNPPNDNTNHVEQKMSCVPYSGCRGLRVLSWFSHPNLPVRNTAFPQFASTQ